MGRWGTLVAGRGTLNRIIMWELWAQPTAIIPERLNFIFVTTTTFIAIYISLRSRKSSHWSHWSHFSKLQDSVIYFDDWYYPPQTVIRWCIYIVASHKSCHNKSMEISTLFVPVWTSFESTLLVVQSAVFSSSLHSHFPFRRLGVVVFPLSQYYFAILSPELLGNQPVLVNISVTGKKSSLISQ